MKGLRGERFKHVIHIDADTVAANGRSFVPPAPPGALFDLLRDPGEGRDLLDEPTEEAARRRAAAMSEELRRRLRVVGHPEEGLLSPEAREGLEALGYLE